MRYNINRWHCLHGNSSSRLRTGPMGTVIFQHREYSDTRSGDSEEPPARTRLEVYSSHGYITTVCAPSCIIKNRELHRTTDPAPIGNSSELYLFSGASKLWDVIVLIASRSFPNIQLC